MDGMNIHDGRKIKNPNRRPFNLILFYQNNKKRIKRIVIFVFILIIIFFPVWSGTLVGEWIKDFFGTIINIVKTI
jgi:hypothetical protein